MTAELLQEAAALMRERAEAATEGPWTPFHAADDFGDAWHVDGDNGSTTVCDAGPPLVGGRQDAEHIASWHPAVALAVADLLDRALKVHSEAEPLELVLHYDSDEECSVCEMGGHEVPVCNGCYPSYEGMDGHSIWPCAEFTAALTIASAYL